MGISYKLENFEGPLDLLLHLIEKNKVNIYDIPIVLITEQYLAFVSSMEEQDLDVVSDFLVMAATLIDIKSRMLLPVDEEDNEEEEDPRAELVRRLLEYKMYKYMARELEELEEGAEKLLYKGPTIPGEVARYEQPVELDALLSGLTLARLQQIFESVIKRKEDKIDPVRSNFGTIRKEPVSLEKKIGTILAYTREHKICSFRQMLERQADKTDVVVTFLAVLELMKLGRIKLTQENIFDDMYIEVVDTGDDEELLSDKELEQLREYEA